MSSVYIEGTVVPNIDLGQTLLRDIHAQPQKNILKLKS